MSVLFPRIEPVGKPYREGCPALNCDMGWCFNSVLGQNVQGHGLKMSLLTVASEKKYVGCIKLGFFRLTMTLTFGVRT